MVTKRILIIDDDADIREATQLCLEITGHWDVLKASSGQEGITMAQLENPDVILLDIMMPGMDGFATLERLKENDDTQQIPIIILTAKSQSQEQPSLGQLKVLSVISKPYDPLTISDQILSALD